LVGQIAQQVDEKLVERLRLDEVHIDPEAARSLDQVGDHSAIVQRACAQPG
jgi:hypothetical protein